MSHALRLLGLLLGVAVLAWLVAQADLTELIDVFPRIGWGFLAILAVRAATIVLNAAAWHCLIPFQDRPPFATLVAFRWIGEAINATLPAAQIGGDVVRARLLQQRISAPARGAASVAVDFCITLVAQILFTVLGFFLLVWLSAEASWWPLVITAALLPVFGIFCWELLVRRRLLAALERGLLRLGRRRMAVSVQALGAALELVASSRAALALSLALHMVTFFGHAVETWLTLYLMGAPTGFAAALMLESISFAARSAAFLIPSGWGAQEATLVALAAAAGLSPDAALALGLVKRAREFAIGLPGLAAWGMAERRRTVRLPG
ncbi:MAG TPA: lysylphosphatidylglycerol synthase domain-containing protein [Stellaceae bacterium]|nr:lysylphosphatidylglycerol synthase domain-containing protein [Stellaceae bacterium]